MNVVVSGYGKMGSLLVQELEHQEGITLQNVVDYLGNYGVTQFTDLTQIPDVIIDFSHPAVLPDLLSYATTHNIPLVIATTNYTNEDINQIREASLSIPIVHTSNTSYGIQVLLDTVKQLQRYLPNADIEIIEHHHNQKVDAPSGTAQMIVNQLKNDQTIVTNGRKGSSKRDSKEIGVHSIRGGSVAGYHEVQFLLNHEVLTISHRAEDKMVFVQGALQCAKFIMDKTPAYYTMNDVTKE